MISSASGVPPYQYAASASSPAATASSSPSLHASLHYAQSTSTSTDTLEGGITGFKSAWLRQLEQQSHVQGTGVNFESRRVELARESTQVQTVADILSQERNRRV